VAEIIGYDGKPVAVRFSATSKVPYLERWQDNVLSPPEGCPWPEFLVKQVRSYAAPRRWFSQVDAEALSLSLGRISKFQSLRSEDALTWSWFGTLACATSDERRRTVQWLYERLGLDLTASGMLTIDQWSRVVHPNAPESPNGPEIDARIDDPGAALIYVEAKWDAALGTGKGATQGSREDQIVLRRDSLRLQHKLADGDRALVVLGVATALADLSAYEEAPSILTASAVEIGWLTWNDLASCEVHPRAAEFKRYLEWKTEQTRRLRDAV
jgi:hypothetical protein